MADWLCRLLRSICTGARQDLALLRRTLNLEQELARVMDEGRKELDAERSDSAFLPCVSQLLLKPAALYCIYCATASAYFQWCYDQSC